MKYRIVKYTHRSGKATYYANVKTTGFLGCWEGLSSMGFNEGFGSELASRDEALYAIDRHYERYCERANSEVVKKEIEIIIKNNG